MLGGNLNLTTRRGLLQGGTLKSIPLCSQIGQTGCVVAFSSYAIDDAGARRVFGANATAEQVGACVNPATLAPQALGQGRVRSYFHKPADGPSEDPPFVEAVGQLSAQCVADAQGAALRYSVEPGRHAERMQALTHAPSAPGWGLHSLDMNLAQGDLVDIVGGQAAGWRR